MDLTDLKPLDDPTSSEPELTPRPVDGGSAAAAALSTSQTPRTTARDFVEDVISVPRCPNLLRHPLGAFLWAVWALFGMLTLILLLAVVAAIPLLNLWVLGYLLEVQGRVARQGKLRYAFPLLDVAPKIGIILFGIWLWIMPIRLLSDAAGDARLIDPTGNSAIVLSRVTLIAACMVTVHLWLALAAGGGFWCFFRPIKNFKTLLRNRNHREFWEQKTQNVRFFFARLRLKHHFWLGLRGLVGVMVWLVLPTALFSAADKTEGGPIFITILGGFLLAILLSWMPFLQARFAYENRFTALFEWRTVRQMFLRAPLAWFLAVAVVYLLTLPLYLLKVVLPPQDAMWLVTLVFILSILPAKAVVGWAYYRAANNPRPAARPLRWLSRLLIAPLLTAYVFLLFFTQFIGEHGKGVLFEHHAFLLPVPF